MANYGLGVLLVAVGSAGRRNRLLDDLVGAYLGLMAAGLLAVI